MGYNLVLINVTVNDLPMPDLEPNSGMIDLGRPKVSTSVVMNGSKPTLTFGQDFTEAMSTFKCATANTPVAAAWMRTIRQLGNSGSLIANAKAGDTIVTYIIKNAKLVNKPELALSSDGKMEFEFVGNSIIQV